MSALMANADSVCRIPIASVGDVVTARQRGRIAAEEIGFSGGEATLLAMVISELARNIVQYAGAGHIAIRTFDAAGRRAIEIVAHDQGPGIKDIEAALRPGFSTSGGLGLGLQGVRRIVDEFHIVAEPRHGTTVTVRKWRD